jgi:protein-S-isoprenylcysteine O-methyltransferase Ste14
VLDLGTNVITMILAGIAFGAAVLLKRRVMAQLRFARLSGIPELSKEKYPGKLLTEGIYSRVRNPRYIEALLWVTAYALFANYLGAYLVVALCLPLIYFVVRLEERELRERFGTAYEEYCRRVPRFVPKLRPRDG